MHGLSFIGFALKMGGHWKIQAEKRKERHKKLIKSILEGNKEELSDEYTEMLEKLQFQVDDAPNRPSERKCVECGRKFILIKIADVEIDYCPMCRSCWFDPGELSELANNPDDVPSDHLKSRDSRYKCPICNAVMRECVYMAPYNLLVDKCPMGHGVYLEDRELERVFDLNR